MKRVYLYLLKRIVLYALIFFISVTVFFFAVMLAPGDPLTQYIKEMSGRYGMQIESNQQMIEEFRAAFGLDKPLVPRYLAYMKQLFLKGNITGVLIVLILLEMLMSQKLEIFQLNLIGMRL